MDFIISISYQNVIFTSINFLSGVKTFNFVRFSFEFRYFQPTYQGEEVGVAIFQGGPVGLVVYVRHFSHILLAPKLHHLRVHFSDFRLKNDKMCLCDKTMMAALRHNKLVEGRLPIGQDLSCDLGNKNGRQMELTRGRPTGTLGTHSQTF